MPESFKTQRYEDRESSKTGPWEYMTQHVPFVLLPFVGFGVGLALRKIINVPLLNAPQGAFGKTAKEIATAAAETGQYVMRRAEAWGFGLGAAYGTYRLWGANTKQQLEVDQITKDVEALWGMESTNQHLKNENAQLRRQIQFSEQHKPAGSHTANLESARSEEHEVSR